MEKIRYNERIKNVLVDAVIGKSVFKYQKNVKDLRKLQSLLFTFAKLLDKTSEYRGIIILDETKISSQRLKLEWEFFNRVLKSSVIDRIWIVVFSCGEIVGKYGEFSEEEIEALYIIQKKYSAVELNQQLKPDAFFEVLRVLLVYMFRKKGPVQINSLEKLTGFSYPTVANSLEKLESYLLRHSDRSIELKTFPRDEWFKLYANKERIRNSEGYAAKRPRSFEVLLEKLYEKPNNNIALGGIIGARYYMPGIDLLGISRLDLCLHYPYFTEANKIVRRLDPGLKKISPGEIPQVVIHYLYRPVSLFSQGNKFKIADEVECLFDLSDARLESQALELLDHLKRKIKE